MKTNDQLRTYGVPIVLANALICDSELPCRVLLYDTQSLSNLGVEFVLTIDFMIFFNTEFLPQVVFLAFPCFVLAFGSGEAASLLLFSSLMLFVSFLQETSLFSHFALCLGSLLFTSLFPHCMLIGLQTS